MAKNFVYLLTLSTAAHTALAGGKLTTTLYALHLHASEAAVGVLAAVFALFPMFFAVAAGRWIDRIGMQTPLLGGTCWMAFGCAVACCGGGTPGALYLAAGAMGSGFMVIHVATQNAVGTHSAPQHRTAHFSHLAVAYSMAGLLGPVVAGFAIGHADHRMSFALCLGLIGLAVGLAALAYQREYRSPCPGGVPSAPSAQSRWRNGTAFSLLQHRGMRGIYGVGLLIGTAQEVFLFVLPLHSVRLGMSAPTVGLLLGGFAGGSLGVRFAMRWIAARGTAWGILACAMALVAACYGVLPFLQTPLGMLPVAVLLGVALGSCQPNVLALLHHHAPAGRTAEAVGLRASLGYASQVALPLALGASSASAGPFVVYWAMGAVAAVSLPALYRRARDGGA